MTTVSDFVSPLSFRIPTWLANSAWTEHGPFAMWLAGELQPRLTVELGSFGGYSLMAFAEALAISGGNGRVIGVDTWQGDEHAGFYGDRLYEQLGEHASRHHPGRVELKRMLFCEALPAVADGSVDLLHVDGRHFYDDVKEDYTSWIPKLAPGAIVLFHDTQVRDRDFGVWRYWSELSCAHPSFEFLHGSGLGVLAPNGRPRSATLAAMLAPGLSETLRDDIRAAYSRLGAGIWSWKMAQSALVKKKLRKELRKSPLKFLVGRLAAGRGA